MNTNTSRRSLLLGAGASILATGCASTQASRKAEQAGAFPDMPYSGELLGPEPGVARLSGNENPYGPAPSALKMIDYAGKKGAFYPGQAHTVLKEMIAERHGVTPDHITLSTGSAEVLSAIAMVYGRKGPIVAPRLFFDATALYAQRLGLAEIQRVPLTDGMEIDIAALKRAVTPETGLVQLCNPNNPTGVLSNTEELKSAVRRMSASAPVVVDEAYIELTSDPEKDSCVDLVRQGHDVIVARTFSKLYGMAGIRVGYAISSPEAAETIKSGVMSWMSGVSLAAAIGCYNDERFVDFSRARIFEGRQMIEETLRSLQLTALPSHANFVYFKSGQPANDLRDDFADRRIQIRGQYMDYADWTRVSVGRLEDVERFCKALPEIAGA